MISKEKTNIKKGLAIIYYTVCPVESTSHIAVHKGFFDKAFRSIGIELQHISSLPRKEWQNHFTHSHPYFFRDGGNIPPIWARSRGADNVAIGVTFPERKQVIIVKKESSIQSVTDLKNKKIALPRRIDTLIDFWRATVHRGIICSLNAHGLKEEDVEFVDISLSDYLADSDEKRSIWSHKNNFKSFIREELSALQEGKVDAVYTEGARVGALEQLNEFKTVYTLSTHQDTFYKVNICFPCVITVSGELARNYPKIVDTYMEALLRAGTWAKENRKEVIGIFSKELYVDSDAIKGSFPHNFHELLMPSMGQNGIEALELEKNFLREKDYILNDFEIKNWINSSFLERAVECIK